jgi:predicted RNase H-like nuclease (RuvC/YqgF family)
VSAAPVLLFSHVDADANMLRVFRLLSYVREFLLEKAIFLLEDEHGPESEIVVRKRDQLKLFKQWQEPYIIAIDKLSEMIERPDAVRLLKPVRDTTWIASCTDWSGYYLNCCILVHRCAFFAIIPSCAYENGRACLCSCGGGGGGGRGIAAA